MSENILVVEYEPRYIERARAALSGEPFSCTFARDGEEALRAMEAGSPRLIVLSSVVPKISTTELIRNVRGRKAFESTPILLTVSGYNGKSPLADAQRVGASDILPKPYTENDLLGRVQQMLGIRGPAPEPQVSPAVLDEPQEQRPRKTMAKPTDDVDKMLEATLAGMMPRKKTEATAPVPTPPAPVATPPATQAAPATPPRATAPAGPAEQKPATRPPMNDLDKRLHDTLSGLEKSARKTTTPGTAPRPAAPAPAPAVPPPARPAPPAPTVRIDPVDRIPVAQPVLPPSVPEPPRVEEEEPADGVRFGQYVLVEKIATGGMAEVWKARMRGVEGFQKIVAIKKILPHLSDNQDFIEMFVDEAKLAAQLNHNNIIHIYDLGKIQSSYYIAMEYIDGYDLKAILRRASEHDQPMSVELALFVASKIAAALDYAHRKRDFEDREMGLVHRDVSPQNVLISQEGDIKLCDFGIAKAASKASHTQAGALKGKLQYMSPEQAWGRGVDRRSDIFALGTVLFEMLTGKKLFAGDSEMSILDQVREARIQPPSQLNDEIAPEIDAVVLKALQKDPDTRYQTAGEMARELDAILYSFKPTPTSADLAIYMHRLSAPVPVAPAVQEPPVSAPEPAPTLRTPPVVVKPAVPVVQTPVAPQAAVAPIPEPVPLAAMTASEPAEKKKSPMPLVAMVAGVLLVAGAAAFVLMRKGDAPPPAPAAKSAARAAVATTAAAAVPPATDTSSTAIAAPATATGTALDPSLVDQEVQRRLAAERARLEAQNREQPAQQTAPARQTPAPAVAQQEPPAPAAPAPAPQESRPAPTPAAAEPAPQQQAEAPRPAAAVPAQSAPRVREGELVAAGTEGLVPPRMLRRGAITYPPLARAQRVEGTVIASVLVSETGQVLDVRIIRPHSRPVGLNEAAEQAMRRSTFTPATKDGVRVRTWLTVPVEFKL